MLELLVKKALASDGGVAMARKNRSQTLTGVILQ
jgi:hypothetical protein